MENLKGEITLVSLAQSPLALGIRYLSSVLRENGYVVNKLFLNKRLENDISSKVVGQISEFSKNSLFIGVSIMTDYVILANNFAQKMRKLNKDAILVGGGIHPTVRPNENLGVFDVVVRGEAEGVILLLAHELAKGKKIKDIRLSAANTSYYNSDQFGFVEDVDSLPYPDFSDNYIFKNGRVCLEEDYAFLFGDYYPILSSRGCPYSCTYCESSFYSENISKRFFRKRSIGKIIDELKFAKERYDIKNIAFPSDNFLSFSESELNDFTSRYKKEINLPFICAAAPNCIKEDHIDRLMQLGLIRVGVGIESGSEKTLKQYRRSHCSPQRILEAARILDKFSPKLSYSFDLILDNPYETKEDLKKTISLLEALPKSYDDLTLYSLTFYPGTYLYDKAVQDGFIEESYYLKGSKYYHKVNKSFYNFIFLLFALKVNKKIIAYFLKYESANTKAARILRAMAANLTEILLAACMFKMLAYSMRHKNKALVFYYIKLGFAVVKSSLSQRSKDRKD